MYFNPVEKSFVFKSFDKAEKLAGEYFKLVPGAWKTHRYDVKTRATLEHHEVSHKAFAHLCKYLVCKEPPRDLLRNFHFYRVCLQDDRILDAVNRGGSFIKLSPLMLYIATHELVHILRFDRGECDFEMPEEARKREEEEVHCITKSILQPVNDVGLNLVLDCFSNDYSIGDLFN